MERIFPAPVLFLGLKLQKELKEGSTVVPDQLYRERRVEVEEEGDGVVGSRR